MSDTPDKRVIKKYPNRRLYDTAESKYVTLSDVRDLVLSGVAFCVIDKKSGDDITRSILLQIIIEQEEDGDPMFSTEVLEQIIGFYGSSVQVPAGDFIRDSLNLFKEQQERFQNQVTGALQSNPVTASFAEVAQRNMDVWQKMQNSFFSAAGMGRDDQKKSDDD
ncbi:MAG: polyhydroxyalkanoate synthesis repressor PhaR [Proteobacteria bacterium]|nr:MAG: polyhydroxyalkanoate synthesis repressor PhaR [Pseudomonadota bacterium]